MKQIHETVTREFGDLIVQTTDRTLTAFLTDRDDRTRQHFCMCAGPGIVGNSGEAYVGVYQEGYKTPEGNRLPYALSETGIQIPRGKEGRLFVKYETLQKLLDTLEGLEEGLGEVLEFLEPK